MSVWRGVLLGGASRRVLGRACALSSRAEGAADASASAAARAARGGAASAPPQRAAERGSANGDAIARCSHLPITVARRRDFRTRVLSLMRKERKVIPAVIVDSDENPAKTTFVSAELAGLHQDQEQGRFFLPPFPISERFFWGPLYDVSVVDGDERVERARCWLVRMWLHPIHDVPTDAAFVRRPLDRPCRAALQVVVLNADRAPGLKQGYFNHLVRCVPVELEPYAEPPDALFLDADGMMPHEFMMVGDLICAKPGVKLLMDDSEPVLRISRVREGRF